MKMKFYTLALVFAMLAGWPTRANGQSRFALGFEGGVNLASADGSPSSLPIDSRVGIMFGGFFEFGISSIFYIEPEVLYVQKGAVINLPPPIVSGAITFKYDYIEIPLLLEAKFGPPASKLCVFGGPNVGFNTNAQIKGTGGSWTQSADVKSSIDKIDFALDLGAGGEFVVGPQTALVLNIRFSKGMIDIYPDDLSSWKSMGIQFTSGLKFGL